MGWHSIGNYDSLQELQEHVDSYLNAGVPLEGIWLSSKYMKSNQTFSVDDTRFAGLKSYLEHLRETYKMRAAPTIGAGISRDSKYVTPAKEGNALLAWNG